MAKTAAYRLLQCAYQTIPLAKLDQVAGLGDKPVSSMLCCLHSL